ncbi:MAG: Efflux transporter, RND family, MFP subunit, partial [uncultured bacterium]
MRFAKLAALIATFLAAIAALVWAFLPQPLLVEITTIRRGAMQVSVSAEGVTRIRDPWTVTAPLTGTVARSPVQVGDAVKRGETTVAVIRPAEPAFLDARARAQAEAAVVEAEA